MPADPAQRLTEAFTKAIAVVAGEKYVDADPAIRPASKPELGDFQCNVAMGLGKRLKRPPRDVAGALVEAVDLGDLADTPEVAGPGFINITLNDAVLLDALADMDTPELGVMPDDDHGDVVIDMCGVNVAKQMHVGHLRSTIIGDAFARILQRLGHVVHRENHLGDWGLPIAMVLHELRSTGVDLESLTLTELDAAYRTVQATATADAKGLEAAISKDVGPHHIAELEEQNAGAAEVRSSAGETLVALQAGDPELVAAWQALIDVTIASMAEALDMLGIAMGPENNRGESFYRDRLQDVLDWFQEHDLCHEDDGALVVRFENRDRAMIVRKSDGGFLYATTDLAAARCRTQETKATRCIYVVDARQHDHFRDVFDAAAMAGWSITPDGDPASFSHTGFGSVLGTDRKPLKTRGGTNVTLISLLREAIDRGCQEVHKRAEDPHAPTHGLDDGELDAIGRAVGIGAVKYADLGNDLIRDYVFDLDRMVAFEGDTGPYLQYAHARIQSIIRKAGDDGDAADFHIGEPAERQLALNLLKWNRVVHATAESLEPHRIAAYARSLAEAFNAFYQSCPVLKADTEDLKRSRLRLADLTGRVLYDALNLLGIEAPDRM
jgi:arginyl-tRNA synthetase